MPRHKLPPEKKRSCFVQVSLTQSELAQLDAHRSQKQSRADLLRESFLKRFDDAERGPTPEEVQ